MRNSVSNIEMFSLLLSCACTETRLFLLLNPTLSRGRLGVHKKLWRDTAGTTDLNGMSWTIWHCAQHIKAQGRRRKGEYLELWNLSSLVTVSHDEALLFWRWPNTHLEIRSS